MKNKCMYSTISQKCASSLKKAVLGHSAYIDKRTLNIGRSLNSMHCVCQAAVKPHTPTFFALVFLGCFFGSHNPPISTSYVAGTTSMHHHTWLVFEIGSQ
jgi:hypothetical protein